MAVRVVLRDVHAFPASTLSIVGILNQLLLSDLLTLTCMRFRRLIFATLLLILLLLEVPLVLLNLAVEEVTVALGKESRG